MEQSNTTTEAAEPRVPPRELVRPREGRMVAGVAQGLADRFDLPVVLIRIVFAVLTFGGGLGLALYAAGWFLIRSEEEPEAMAERLFSGASTSRSWIGIGLVFIAILILLDNFTFLSGGIVWAVGLLVVGVLLYTGDLPRLIKQDEDDDEEGAQQMTTTESEVRATARTDAPSGAGPAGGGAPPTSTPTPPILPPAAAEPRPQSFLGRITIGVMLVSLGMLAILDNIPGIALEPEPRHYMALAVTVLGLGLMVGGFLGRARWLILLGVVLVPTLLFSPAFEYDWTSETFERTVSPETFDELEDSYHLDVGSLSIDLTDLPWEGESIDMLASVDAGNIRIYLPDEVGVVGAASVDVGRVSALGRESSGLGNPTIELDEPGSKGTVALEALVDVGNIDIVQVGN